MKRDIQILTGQVLAADCRKTIAQATPRELYNAVSKAALDLAADAWKRAPGKRVAYLSAEFLVGRLVYANLLNMGRLGEVQQMLLDGENVWVHCNNSGRMLGLTLAGAPLLASPAANPARKLPYTQEAVWLAERAVPPLPGGEDDTDGPAPGRGFWVGVNTSVPNRMIEAAFHAGRLDFAAGYTQCRREAKRGESRLDACLTGPDLPPLWVECKNVTMVEDGVACFPDAATERGQKHLRELMDIVRCGERAAMFYLVQRPDGHCFGPADVVDPAYAALFYEAMDAGVEIYPYRASVSPAGIELEGLLPVAPRPAGL